MPTTEPLDDGDDVGGPLKPIAEFSEPAPKPETAAASARTPQTTAVSPSAVETPTQPKSAAAPAHAGAARPVLHVPVVGRPQNGRTLRTNLDNKVLSINNLRNQQAANAKSAPAQAETAAAPRPSASDRTFTDDELREVWETYIVTHGHEQLLTNTMRSHLPTRADSTATALRMEVESQLQADIVAESLNTLLEYLRNSLSNGSITLDTDILQGLNSPSTWNEREVLADMLRRHPDMRAYVDDLGLTLG